MKSRSCVALERFALKQDQSSADCLFWHSTAGSSVDYQERCHEQESELRQRPHSLVSSSRLLQILIRLDSGVAKSAGHDRFHFGVSIKQNGRKLLHPTHNRISPYQDSIVIAEISCLGQLSNSQTKTKQSQRSWLDLHRRSARRWQKHKDCNGSRHAQESASPTPLCS